MKWTLEINDETGVYQLDLEAETKEEQKLLRLTLEKGGKWELDPTTSPPTLKFLGVIQEDEP